MKQITVKQKVNQKVMKKIKIYHIIITIQELK